MRTCSWWFWRSVAVAVIAGPVMILSSSSGSAGVAAGSGSPQWSMYGHDSAHTGRSPARGPTTAHLVWKFELPVPAQDNASPVVGLDGTVYMPTEQGLYAINPDGTLKWRKWTGAFDVTYTRGAPAVARNGTVYVWKSNFLSGGRLFALNPRNGAVLWSTSVGDVSYSSPTIGPDGTIYIGSFDGPVYAINPDGTRKWVFHPGSANCGTETSAALGPDGTVYIQHNCRGLIALNPNGTLKWNRGPGSLGEAWDSPSVGPDGTIYIGSSDYFFYAYRPNGTMKWRVPVRAWMYMSSSAIATGGSAIYRGDNGGNFYAFSSSGRILWRFRSPDGGGIYTAPALSANGLVYFTQEVTRNRDPSVYALRASSGKVVWSYKLGPADASPALAPDGTLYVAAGVPGGRETIYAFR